jgi:hypothetical protein
MKEEEEVERSDESFPVNYKRDIDEQSRKMKISPHVLFPDPKLRL